jgi:DNA-binding MarR family transcriptional regulator
MTSRPAPSADATELYFSLGAVVKRLRRNQQPGEALGAALAGAAPAPRHVFALLQVASEARLGMSELADRLGVSLATASQVVTDLADWGLIERSSDDVDRRRTYVTIAPAHQATISALLDSRLRPLERALRRLEPDERTALVRGLTVLADELDQATAEEPVR